MFQINWILRPHFISLLSLISLFLLYLKLRVISLYEIKVEVLSLVYTWQAIGKGIAYSINYFNAFFSHPGPQPDKTGINSGLRNKNSSYQATGVENAFYMQFPICFWLSLIQHVLSGVDPQKNVACINKQHCLLLVLEVFLLQNTCFIARHGHYVRKAGTMSVHKFYFFYQKKNQVMIFVLECFICVEWSSMILL